MKKVSSRIKQKVFPRQNLLPKQHYEDVGDTT